MVTALLAVVVALLLVLAAGYVFHVEYRKPRKVRVITDSDKTPDFEGIQLGRRPVAGHYVLLAGRVLKEQEDDATKIDVTALDGPTEIPAGRVLFVQVITS